MPNIILGDGWAQWIMAALTLSGVLISGWAVWLLKKTLDATVSAIREGEKTTAAAVEANQILRNEQRPWILFDGIDAEYFPAMAISGAEPEAAIRFRLKFKNFGSSPAIDAEVFYHCLSINAEPMVGSQGSSQREVVAPGVTILPRPFFLTNADIANFWYGELEVLFVAQVRYFSPDRSLSGFISYSIQVSYRDHEKDRDDERCRLEVLAEVHVDDGVR